MEELSRLSAGPFRTQQGAEGLEPAKKVLPTEFLERALGVDVVAGFLELE